MQNKKRIENGVYTVFFFPPQGGLGCGDLNPNSLTLTLPRFKQRASRFVTVQVSLPLRVGARYCCAR